MKSAILDRPRRIRRVLVLTVLAAVFVLVTGLMDTVSGLALAQWSQQPARLLMNALPGLLLAALLLALTRRAALSVVLALLVEALLYGVNALKMANLGTPLLPADFYMIGQLTHGADELLRGYLPDSLLPYAVGVGLLMVVALLAWYERPVFRRRARLSRLSLASACVLVLATLIVGTWPWRHVYESQRNHMKMWEPAAAARDLGLVNTLVLYHLYFGPQQQKPDIESARRLLTSEDAALDRYMRRPAAAGARPDIVVIESESFFDPVIMNGYQNAGFNPNLHRLARQGISGFMQVPTFGGGTIRTEFEVLTGMPLRYLEGVQFPYLELNQRVIPSLVQTLQGHGYQTFAIHGSNPNVWERARTFRRMGFERFVSGPDFPPDAPKDGRFMADSAMTDEILAQLAALDDDAPPQFVFAISIEAHGAYNVSPGIDPKVRDAIPVPDSVTDPGAKIALRNYLYHMGNADRELGRLVAALRKRERPTLVVFYGDHLPGLLDAYRQAGFVDGKDAKAQSVPWLMVNTHDAGPARHVDTTAWMLPGMILDRIGIHDAPYFALTQLVGPGLLARALGTQGKDEDESRGLLDAGMASLTKLRLRDRLDELAAPIVANWNREPEDVVPYASKPTPSLMGYGTGLAPFVP